MRTRKIEPQGPAFREDDDLPEGWVWARLGLVCDLNPPKPQPTALSSEAPVTFVPMPAVDAEAGKITRPQQRPFSEVRKGFTAFADGDVIMAKITPCMENGKAAIARGLTNGQGFGSTEFHVLRPNGAATADWIYYFIRQESFRKQAESEMTGSVGQKRVPRDFLKESEIPLPPIPEQRRIVEKVETLLARVNAARARLARAPALLKAFRQAVLSAACSGKLTEVWREGKSLESTAQLLTRLRETRPTKADLGVEFPVKRWRVAPPRQPQLDDLPCIPETWAWVYLPDLGYMNRGRSRNRPRNAPHLYGEKYPFIQTGDIAQSGGRIVSHKQAYSEAGLAQSRLWPAGTICITIAANIADSAILTYPSCFPDSVVGLISDLELCVAEFAEFFIRTAREDLSQFAPATAQKNINIGILEEVAVPLPPLEEQIEIVRRVEALFALADTVEAKVASAQKRADALTQAILAKAFRGELVPTEAALARAEGRPYQSASELLEHLRREKALPTAAKVPRQSRRRGVGAGEAENPGGRT